MLLGYSAVFKFEYPVRTSRTRRAVHRVPHNELAAGVGPQNDRRTSGELPSDLQNPRKLVLGTIEPMRFLGDACFQPIWKLNSKRFTWDSAKAVWQSGDRAKIQRGRGTIRVAESGKAKQFVSQWPVSKNILYHKQTRIRYN